MNSPLQITSGRHPFQVAVTAATTAAATALLATGVRPTSTAALPDPLETAWLVLLGAGGLIALIGSHWPRALETGLWIEAGGLSMTATMTGLYVTALAVIHHQRAAATGALLAGITAAAAWRAVQILHDLARLRRAAHRAQLETFLLLTDHDDGGGDRP